MPSSFSSRSCAYLCVCVCVCACVLGVRIGNIGDVRDSENEGKEAGKTEESHALGPQEFRSVGDGTSPVRRTHATKPCN